MFSNSKFYPLIWYEINYTIELNIYKSTYYVSIGKHENGTWGYYT